MIFRPFFDFDHGCAAYLFGCGTLLAERVGAAYCLHRAADVRRPFTPVDDGEEIGLGNTRMRVLHTPGHTPESISLVVTDLRRGPAPWFVIAGDTLLSGAVGRPDLPGAVRENASLLYTSLHEKLLALPDDVEAYPAHFGRSACRAGLSGKPSSTIGFEKRFSPALSLERGAFVDAVGVAMPKPADSEAVLEFNRGPAPL